MFLKHAKAKKWAVARLAKNLRFDRAVIEYDSCAQIYSVMLYEKHERCLSASSAIVEVVTR